MPNEENYYTDEDLLKESIKFVLSWFLQVPRPLSSGTSYIDSRGNSTQHFDFFFFPSSQREITLSSNLREVRWSS